MTAQAGDPVIQRPDRHLLEQKAIWADLGIGVNHDAIGMGQQKPSPNFDRNWNIGARHCAPESMAENRDFRRQDGKRVAGIRMPLVSTDAGKQRTRRAPRENGLMLARPVRFDCGNFRICHRSYSPTVCVGDLPVQRPGRPSVVIERDARVHAFCISSSADCSVHLSVSLARAALASLAVCTPAPHVVSERRFSQPKRRCPAAILRADRRVALLRASH